MLIKRFALQCLTATLTTVAVAAVHAASLPAGGYAQSFDGMGTSGTAAPDGWSVFVGPSGTSNGTRVSTIPAAGVAALVPTSAVLTATAAPAGTNNNGFNAALSASSLTDRVLATSPTSFSGGALQLTLTNDTGVALPGLNVSFDTVRFSSVGTANQLPGYWLFYSLDGANWNNVSGLNPSLASVPNTVGVTSTAGSFSFASPVAAGGSVWLRWVDDNAQETSPDQIIGLNNLTVTAVPEPGTWMLLLGGLSSLAAWGVRRRKGWSLSARL
jgi:hypothetical protein